ncbi:hypothetical protein PIB30_040545 [Stylosanthes scabra]|uniref:Uncharacterized protein n=1 Tax=Stylosanthes scabra TaxID=79078 RepID=A0ABU6UFW6_9FABA|nr:hypothetical protein [Stylosanthes scabra]
MRTHNARRVVDETPLCVRTRDVPLRTHQPTEKAGPSNTAPVIPDPIIISSDSEEDLDLKDESEEVPEYIPGAEPIEEEEEEEIPEYIPGEGLVAGQDLEDEESEEEDPEMDPDQDMEDEEMEEEAEQDPNDDEDFVDYFELAPPTSPDISDESLLPTND